MNQEQIQQMIFFRYHMMNVNEIFLSKIEDEYATEKMFSFSPDEENEDSNRILKHRSFDFQSPD